jgi:hypothetical protein
VHLEGPDFDEVPYETIARTTDEVAQAILARVALFSESENQGLYIDKNGTIFDFTNINVKLHPSKVFFVDHTVVTYEGETLPLTVMQSEGIVTFVRAGNGDIELFDNIDKRKGKGIFINQKGEIYRA